MIRNKLLRDACHYGNTYASSAAGTHVGLTQCCFQSLMAPNDAEGLYILEELKICFQVPSLGSGYKYFSILVRKREKSKMPSSTILKKAILS